MRIFIFLVFILALDLYSYFGLKVLLSNSQYQKIGKYTFLIFSAISYVGILFLFKYFANHPLYSTPFRNLIIGFAFAFLLFKMVFILFLFIDDAVRLLSYILNFIIHLFDKSTANSSYPDRRKFIGQIGLGIAAIPFLSMLYGSTKGKYNFKVINIKLDFANLPSAFDGLKLVHISDIHSGSFDSLEAVQRGIDLINAQNADIICFTGDLVNNDSREIEPFIQDFKALKSKYGIYSCLGNHDYGDYKHWKSKEVKQQNLETLFKHHQAMGFKLLNNSNVELTNKGEKIVILGVENWGKPPFPQHGDLDKALKNVNNADFKILLSHDPSHWDYKVLTHPTNIDLTLSGHTHGMQFGVEIPGFKWSPIKYLYPRWAGLYQEATQYLYVNRGFGFLGFPGRVGIWPEITVIELKKTVA